jgi:hypothetical protein
VSLEIAIERDDGPAVAIRQVIAQRDDMASDVDAILGDLA